MEAIKFIDPIPQSEAIETKTLTEEIKEKFTKLNIPIKSENTNETSTNI